VGSSNSLLMGPGSQLWRTYYVDPPLPADLLPGIAPGAGPAAALHELFTYLSLSSITIPTASRRTSDVVAPMPTPAHGCAREGASCAKRFKTHARRAHVHPLAIFQSLNSNSQPNSCFIQYTNTV